MADPGYHRKYHVCKGGTTQDLHINSLALEWTSVDVRTTWSSPDPQDHWQPPSQDWEKCLLCAAIGAMNGGREQRNGTSLCLLTNPASASNITMIGFKFESTVLRGF
ncbi:hypothetical protein TNCV_1075411 [Trichonephila clavipes]|uniref:Uncharacterized protein n=1 Tax=Trichonephila clavipes TaxID=2585209 RepID=A0A8X6ST72_TRICX|nr:hypothetical protein TNCV_1075411 [Trichonephila clavipes]